MKDSLKNVVKSFVLVSVLAAFTLSASASSYQTGDLDGDGAVTAADALLILEKTTGIIDKFPVDETEQSGISEYSAIVTTDDRSTKIKNDDGITLVTAKLQYPVVEIAGNPEAAKVINQTLESQLMNIETLNTMAQETAEIIASGYDSSYPSTYDINYEVKRNDRILSIVIHKSQYLISAAHENYSNTAFNFDISTGALITPSMLFNSFGNTDFVCNYAADYVYSQVSEYETISYSYELYDMLINGTNRWYLDATGNYKVFFNPYEAAPSAMGIVEVTIPDADLYYDDYYYNLINGYDTTEVDMDALKNDDPYIALSNSNMLCIQDYSIFGTSREELSSLLGVNLPEPIDFPYWNISDLQNVDYTYNDIPLCFMFQNDKLVAVIYDKKSTYDSEIYTAALRKFGEETYDDYWIVPSGNCTFEILINVYAETGEKYLEQRYISQDIVLE